MSPIREQQQIAKVSEGILQECSIILKQLRGTKFWLEESKRSENVKAALALNIDLEKKMTALKQNLKLLVDPSLNESSSGAKLWEIYAKKMKPTREVISASILLFDEKGKLRALEAIESFLKLIPSLSPMLRDFTMSDDELVRKVTGAPKNLNERPLYR